MKATAVLGVVVLIAMSMTGCTESGDDKPKLIQTGSSTVLPLAIAWAEEFDDADIFVSGGGSSHGINSLLNEEADLGDASRLMKGSDYEKVGGSASDVNADGTAKKAAPTGVWPYKWIVAYDVLTVVVNNGNTWAGELNYTQLYSIFTAGSSRIAKATYWDQVPGLNGTAPHEKIEIYAPDAASGTYDYFFEEIIPDWGDDTQETDTRLDTADEYQGSADDNVILTAIKNNEYSIGFFGYSYYKENTAKVKAVSIASGDDDYVAPAMENVADYPMARPLHIYTDGVPTGVIKKYMQYVLSDEGQALVPEVGYVKLELVDPALVTSQRAALEA